MQDRGPTARPLHDPEVLHNRNRYSPLRLIPSQLGNMLHLPYSRSAQCLTWVYS